MYAHTMNKSKFGDCYPQKILLLRLINLSSKTFVVKGGARIAQMVLCPIVKAKFKEVDC